MVIPRTHVVPVNRTAGIPAFLLLQAEGNSFNLVELEVEDLLGLVHGEEGHTSPVLPPHQAQAMKHLGQVSYRQGTSFTFPFPLDESRFCGTFFLDGFTSRTFFFFSFPFLLDVDLGVGGPVGTSLDQGRLLQEYEAHLRNALAEGMDADSLSLHTFETMLSGSEYISTSTPAPT